MLALVINKVKSSVLAVISGVATAITGTDLTAFGYTGHVALDVLDQPSATLLTSIISLLGLSASNRPGVGGERPGAVTVLNDAKAHLIYCVPATVADALYTVRVQPDATNEATPKWCRYDVHNVFKLTGVVAVNIGSAAVTGMGTRFLEEVAPGQQLAVDVTGAAWAEVLSVESDAGLTLSAVYPGPTGAPCGGAAIVSVTSPATAATARKWTYPTELLGPLAEGDAISYFAENVAQSPAAVVELDRVK